MMISRFTLFSFCLLLLAAGCKKDSSTPLEKLEREYALAGKVMMKTAYGLPEDAGARSVFFSSADCSERDAYFRNSESGEYFRFTGDELRKSSGKSTINWGTARLFISADNRSLFVDGEYAADVTGWEFFLVGKSRSAPRGIRHTAHPEVNIVDGYMRTGLENTICSVDSGTFYLSQHGGGMPESEEDSENYKVERAVNPFTVIGSDGMLRYGHDDWMNYYGEVCFYFGAPVEDSKVVDLKSMPKDLMVIQGSAGGSQVSFGWWSVLNMFLLCERSAGEEEWTILERWRGALPGVTNWVNIGLAVENGCHVKAFLNGAEVLRAKTSALISGPFFIKAGLGKSEFDDVKICSLPLTDDAAGLYYVKSKNFAKKEHKSKKADPEQFDEWAKGEGTFKKSRYFMEGKMYAAQIVTGSPLLGDFQYESQPINAEGEDFPEGMYEIRLFPVAKEYSRWKLPEPLFTLRLEFKEGKWLDVDTVLSEEGMEPTCGAVLRLRRRKEDGNNLQVFWGNDWKTIYEQTHDKIQLGIGRGVAGYSYLKHPDPDHHRITCTNLTNELFEVAPTEWAWLDGAFRMATRWACEGEWNFMSCGSTGLPMMTSRTQYRGNQIHEFFMSLRAAFPWDVGDETFEYDSLADRRNGFKILHKYNGWYSRRDLNFSFCTDGKNPLSGYAILFGTNDNEETLLMRKGEIVARTTKSSFLFSRKKSHHAVHWNWWKFTVRMLDGRILVFMNDRKMFDFTDPEPLKKGHVSFWSIRNGYCIAKYSVIAESSKLVPEVGWIPSDDDCSWKPLVKNAVTVTREKESAKVVNNWGGGFFAARWKPEEKAKLAETPVISIPVTIAESSAVNLHLNISGTSLLVKLNGPTEKMKSFLTEEFEKGECFQLPDMSAQDVNKALIKTVFREKGKIVVDCTEISKRFDNPELISMTIGNTSNKDFLLVGNNKNQAGAFYLVGKPEFSKTVNKVQ